MERQGLVLILMDGLPNLKERANVYTSKAALGKRAECVSVTRSLQAQNPSSNFVDDTFQKGRC